MIQLEDTKEKNDIKFIDFEYGAMNFRGMDFGHHFTEYRIDYSVPNEPWDKIDETKMYKDEEIVECLKIYLIFSEHRDKITDEAALYNNEGEADKFIKANGLESEFK